MGYILARKLGKKWTGISHCDLGEGSCLRQAERYFIEQGYPNPEHHPEYRITWDTIETQRNYIGRAPVFREC